MKELNARIDEIMKELGMDAKNEELFADIALVYLMAQADFIKLKMEGK